MISLNCFYPCRSKFRDEIIYCCVHEIIILLSNRDTSQINRALIFSRALRASDKVYSGFVGFVLPYLRFLAVMLLSFRFEVLQMVGARKSVQCILYKFKLYNALTVIPNINRTLGRSIYRVELLAQRCSEICIVQTLSKKETSCPISINGYRDIIFVSNSPLTFACI